MHGTYSVKFVGINVMLGVRKMIRKFCTRIFAFYMLTKNKTTNVGTVALNVLVGPMLHATTTTQLKMMSMTTVFNQRTGDFHDSLKLFLYLGQSQ